MALDLENLKGIAGKASELLRVIKEGNVLELSDEDRETLNKTAENYKSLSIIIEDNFDKLRKDIENIKDDSLKEQLEEIIWEFPRNPAFKRIMNKIEQGERLSVPEVKNFMEEMISAKDLLSKLETEVDLSFNDLINQFVDSIEKLSSTDLEQSENIKDLVVSMNSQAELISKDIMSLETNDLDSQQLEALEAQKKELEKLNGFISRIESLTSEDVELNEDSKQELSDILTELKDTTFESKMSANINNVDAALRSLSLDQEKLNETLEDLNETNKSVIAGVGEKIGGVAKSFTGSLVGGLLEQLGLGALAGPVSEAISNVGLGDIANLAEIGEFLGFGGGARRDRGTGRFTKGRTRRRRGIGGLVSRAGGLFRRGGGGDLRGVGGRFRPRGKGGLLGLGLGAVGLGGLLRGGDRGPDVTGMTLTGADLISARSAKGATGLLRGAEGAKGLAAGGKITGLLGKGGKVGAGLLKGAGRAARFLGPVGAVVTAGMAAYDIYSGVKRVNEIFELGEKEATLGQKTAAGLGSAISGLTFGLIGEKTAAKGVHKVGEFLSDYSQYLGPGGALIKGITNLGKTKELFGLGEGEEATVGQKVSAGLGGALSAFTFGLIDNKKAVMAVNQLGKFIAQGFGESFAPIKENLAIAFDWIKEIVGKVWSVVEKVLSFTPFGGAAKGVGDFFGNLFKEDEEGKKKEETAIVLPKGDGEGVTVSKMEQKPATMTDVSTTITKNEMKEREMMADKRTPSTMTTTGVNARNDREVYIDKRSSIDDLGLFLLNTDYFN